MDVLLEKQPKPTGKFTKRAVVQYESFLLDNRLINFEVLDSPEGGVTIDFSIDDLDESSTVGSTIPKVKKVSPSGLKNFIHDFTFGHYASSTDRRFHNFFMPLNDGFDSLSPDMIVRTPSGHHHVIEFATFRGGDAGAESSALSKISKYEIACSNRSEQFDITLSVITVYKNGIWTNMIFEEDEVDELVYRFRLAVSIFSVLEAKYPDITNISEEMSLTEGEVIGIVADIKMDWGKTEEQFPYFKKEMFESFKSRSKDSDYVSRIISKTILESERELASSSFYNLSLDKQGRLEKNKEECVSLIDAYIESYESRDFVRDISDPKSTVQFPPWVSTPGPEGKDLDPLKRLVVEGSHPMVKIWMKVALNASLEVIERMHDDPEAELQYAMSGSILKSDERNKYHRTVVDMTKEEEDYASALGVKGKKHRDDHLVKESRLRSKKQFSLRHDISELTKFLKDPDPSLFRQGDYYCPLKEDYDLRTSAASIHQPKLIFEEGENEFLRCHKDFTESRIGSWLQMISIIGGELSASVKQHVKDKHFIVKRLKDSGIYMLIRPTSSKGHIFVSLAIDKDCFAGTISDSRVFKPFIEGGGVFVTEFISFKLSKITNLCKLFSLAESSLSFWTECHEENPWEMVSVQLEKRRTSPDIQFMFKLSLLTMLEDKATTEELQTLMRYIVMEGFVSEPELPKPHKMVEKIPKVLRSELQVFLAIQVLKTMMRISGEPFRVKGKEGRVTWSGLFNPFSGSMITELQILISCCYNGYFKNKEEETEPSALSRIYKKIIELEHLRPESPEFLGYGDPEDPKMHEFSVSYLKEMIEHAKSLLSKSYGNNFMDQIDSQIVREISHLTMERIATLKASSNFDKDWYIYKDVKDKNYTRDKLIVKVAEMVESGSTLVIQKFNECMRVIEERGAMHICLFKKQQHGGDREIYVMGAEERIVQSVVECISRSIGKFFASDTLCNPNNKTKIPESHGLRARRHIKGPVWTCATSDDAQKWNQGHFVTKFALMLCEFTHARWWPIIIRGCSMFTRKFMMMNLKFINILDSKRELNLEDDFATTLFSAYHGEIQVPWMDRGRTYLQTSTGMMQGILHFTSSLLHTIHQEFIRSLAFKIYNMKVGPHAGKRIICDMMQGSDDSSMIISFPNSGDEELYKNKITAAICFRVKKKLGIYAGIYPSKKSTSNTDFVMEYNSEFFFHTQHVRPTIRWVAASCTLPEVETLVARQEEATNLLTAISEGGGSFSLSAVIQQAQCTLHYMLMGMGFSSLFREYSRAILRWKDPGLGFFLLDNPYCCGLGGFRFNLFRAIVSTDLEKVYAYFMSKVRKGEAASGGELPESCSVSPGGAIVMSSALRWGSKQKFDRLRSRLNIPVDWIEQINEQPEILYRAPRTGNEILLRIAEKVHSPGVVSSLSNGNSVCRVMASSVYFLSAAIFQDTGRPEFSILNDSKYSLLQKLAAFETLKDNYKIQSEDLIFLFPNIDELVGLDDVVHNRGRIEMKPRVSFREATQTKILVFDERNALRVAPEKIVSDKWFGTQKCKIGKIGLDMEWEKLKTIVKWLDESQEVTLRQTPFENHIQIKNFFARMEGKSRTVRITGAPVKRRSGISKIALVIRDNFSRTGHLDKIEDITGTSRSFRSEITKHAVFCTVHGPYSDVVKEQHISKILRQLPLIELREQDGRTKSNLLAVMQRYFLEEEDVPDLMYSINAGILGAFTYPQSAKKIDGKVFYHGSGSWRGVMDGVQVHIDIYNEVGETAQIRSIKVYGTRSPWEICQNIRSWCDDVGARNDYDASRQKVKSNADFWMFGFKMSGAGHPLGAPVYILNHPMEEIERIQSSKIGFKIRGKVLNLYVKSKAGRDMHILSYSSTEADVSPSIMNGRSAEAEMIRELFSAEPSKSWFTFSKLPTESVRTLLKVASGHYSTSTIDPEKLSDLLKLCTESSLRNKVGTIYSMLTIKEEQKIMDYDDMFDLMLEDMQEDQFDIMVESMKEDLYIEEEALSIDMEDLNLFGPAHYLESTSMGSISHPLMDKFVEDIVNDMKDSNVRRLLETHIVRRCHLEMAELLYTALKRPLSYLKIEEGPLRSDNEMPLEKVG
ncbi:RNA-dependent RNA polymerase [Tapara virus]|uniref:RNA-directed RNA polymerase L n=1 Tax=Tapara virus TaxID=1926501 RepID=A0A1S5SHW1_9VIRU|nr:RNA-dependent RNA polymerase [Tapara virus]API68892.1 RNA-dependent RNA polymerase [Tapara virus]